MIPEIVHQLDHKYRCEYWVGGIRYTPIVDTLQEAIDLLIAVMRKHFGKIITKDDIKYWEWSMALDVVRPGSFDEGFKIETMINEQEKEKNN